MGKFNQLFIEKVVTLIEEDNYTMTDICRIMGVSRKMFYQWKSSKPKFAEAVNGAVQARGEKLRQKARQAMRKKLDGHKLIETKTTYMMPKDSEDPHSLSVKEYVVREKYCVPETSAIVHSLSDGDPLLKGRNNPEEASPLVITVDKEKTKDDLEMLRNQFNQ